MAENGPELSEEQERFYTESAPGTEGIRSASDPDWAWSHHTTVSRAGPSETVRAKIREMTRRLGPPPDDLEIYGTFDDAEERIARAEAEAAEEAARNRPNEAAIELARAAQAELRERMEINAQDAGDLNA